MHVVERRQALGDHRVPLFVDHEGTEDRSQRGIVRALGLLTEQRPRKPLDAGHVGEVLHDGDLVVARQHARSARPVEVSR